MLYDMMTKREFYKANEEKAFETAMKVCQSRRSYLNRHWPRFTADVAAEANLILHEWFRDYQEEHV